MRVTNSMMSASYLKNLNKNLNNLNIINNQLTTGKEISKPSDNPFKTARVMQLYSDIATNKQYNENIVDTSNWLDTTDTALSQLGDGIERIRELMVSAGNATYGSDELGAIKDEINEKINEIAQVMNTNYEGKYIFGGTKCASKPVGVVQDANGNNKLVYLDSEGNQIDDTTDEGKKLLAQMGTNLKVEVSNGVVMEYSVGATELMNVKEADGTVSVDVMSLLNDIVNNLDAQKTEDLIGTNLSDIDKDLANINTVRGQVGAKQNRMEAAETQNEDQNLNLKEVLSNIEDIDLAEKTIEFATLQAVYQAALQVSASVVQLSILDFI